jgi:hypothetical protein
LLAAFLQAGHPVLTDDMLVLARQEGRLAAFPGSGRIKLMPDSARAFWDGRTRGTRLTPSATKRSFPLVPASRQSTPLQMGPFYVLPEPDERDRVTAFEACPISGTEMVRQLLKNSFTTEVFDRGRLARQFAFSVQVASDVSGFTLRYPAGLQHIPALRHAIVEHVRQTAVDDGPHSRTA